MDSGSALVGAMLYGKLEGLSPETLSLFARTGLIHLFSASGFHMGAALMIAALLAKMLKPFLQASTLRFLAFFFSLALMTFFGSATAWSSPLVRAYAFTTLLAAAKLWEVKPSKLWTFALSLLAAALFGKGSALSFFLSAAGMAGVIYCGGKNIFSLAMGPWLFTMPIVIWNFSLASLASPLWNLTFGVTVSWTVLPLAILSLLLSSIGVAWQFPMQAAAWLMQHFTYCLIQGDKFLPLAYWVNPLPFLGLSFALAFFWKWHQKSRGKGPLLALLVVVLLFWIRPSVKLAALDVGQGDSLFLRMASGETLLVDAGPPPWKRSSAPSSRALEALGVAQLDHLLLTHAHRDHIGGAPSLLLSHNVKIALWMRQEMVGEKAMLATLEAAERAEVPVRFLSESSVKGLQCWLPPPDSANESSPLCRAGLLGNHSIWLTGDSGIESEKWLLRRQPVLPQAEYLKVGHHGSRFSSSEEFLRATGARIAFVSVGRKNRYGHPAPSTLERLQKIGFSILRTDQGGTAKAY